MSQFFSPLFPAVNFSETLCIFFVGSKCPKSSPAKNSTSLGYKKIWLDGIENQAFCIAIQLQYSLESLDGMTLHVPKLY